MDVAPRMSIVAAPSGSDPRRPSRAVVLVVDDDAWLRHILGALLTEEGFEVLEASDGLSAVHLARRCHPDAIILDVGLPRASGLEVLEELRADARTAQSRVLLVSGSDQFAMDPRARTATRLLKPVDVDKLLRCLADGHSQAA